MALVSPEQRFGATLESTLDRRERAASAEGANFGANRLFKGLAERVLSEIKPEARVLEVDPAAGLFTRLLLARGAEVTALEPVEAFFDYLSEIPDEHLTLIEGFTEDLPKGASFDYALVSFAARRGKGLLALINEVLPLVAEKLFLVIPDDGSLDWAYLMRAAALEGLNVSARFLVDTPALIEANTQANTGESGRALRAVSVAPASATNTPVSVSTAPVIKRAVLITVLAGKEAHIITAGNEWELSARTIEVPYPVPRGAATRLIRYFVAGGDRAVLIKTEPPGIARLYGNLRTAAHRIARDEVTVRRVDDGVQLMQIPHR
jgi:hypothetical protein